MNYKQYNEELIEENSKLREENIHLSMLNMDLEMYLKEHEQKINKAIEILKDTNVNDNSVLLITTIDYALHILGDKEDE